MVDQLGEPESCISLLSRENMGVLLLREGFGDMTESVHTASRQVRTVSGPCVTASIEARTGSDDGLGVDYRGYVRCPISAVARTHQCRSRSLGQTLVLARDLVIGVAWQTEP